MKSSKPTPYELSVYLAMQAFEKRIQEKQAKGIKSISTRHAEHPDFP